ncbi:MAG: response regulator [Planctomycetota bacterium]|nr:MAG: response regulator [Planctomycetota bacterium]
MSTAEPVGRPMEILYVEDSITAAQMTIGALRSGNVQHRMTWLDDGREAYEFLMRIGKFAQAPRPDLVLLDLTLPNLDGRELLKAIRRTPELQDVPVVILTASSDPTDVQISEELNVQAYLTKPIDLGKFLWLVKELKGYWLKEVILPEVD